MAALRFAYSTINWGVTPDVPEMFRQIREAGWVAVELFNHSIDWLGLPGDLRGPLGGLQVATSFGSVELPTDHKQLVVQKHRIDFAAALGAEAYGLVGGGRLRWRPPSQDEYADLANFCEELAVYGQEKGVLVSYHPHTGCTIERADEIDDLMSRTKALRLCLDASHIALVDEDPVAHLRTYRERTGYIHLKDWAGGKFVEMGQGAIGIDFAAVLHELEEQHFPGWVVIEHSRSDVSPLQSARANADYLKSLGYSIS